LPWCKPFANEPRGRRRHRTDFGGTKPGQDGTERHQTDQTARGHRTHNPEVAGSNPARATSKTAGQEGCRGDRVDGISRQDLLSKSNPLSVSDEPFSVNGGSYRINDPSVSPPLPVPPPPTLASRRIRIPSRRRPRHVTSLHPKIGGVKHCACGHMCGTSDFAMLIQPGVSPTVICPPNFGVCPAGASQLAALLGRREVLSVPLLPD